ncbi:histidine phosphatase superfamily [Dactylonectria estremocensis]|uniref:Histidine phosphatase superfamily n=1 Tax=Dactylonectria estremocensis TaxID=1079267 RepID=A0A9P9DN26_9HYPO|nr:histidine phosphatase superfamily [Dactylonectria estremocensis]
MPPTIVLIRHAQALHNVDKDYSIHDPPLSELGVEQCAALRRQLQTAFADTTTNLDHVAVIVSPMRRTMQTAMLSLDWLVERGVKCEANADWQENSDKPCDTGSPISSLTGDFPQVNFNNVDPVWPDKTSNTARRYAHTRRDILNRGKYGLEALKQRPEKLVFVVSHSGFLRVGVVGYWFFNSDYRIFDFDQGAGGLNLKQQESTIAGGMGLSWTEPVALGSELPDWDDTV